MSWALKGLPGSERIVEYEAKLTPFCREASAWRLPVRPAQVRSERAVGYPGDPSPGSDRTEVYDNFYYMPPQEFLGANFIAAKLNKLAEPSQGAQTLRDPDPDADAQADDDSGR